MPGPGSSRDVRDRIAACGGEAGEEHTVVVDSRDAHGGTEYTLRVSDTVDQVNDDTVAGISVSDGDDVQGGSATGLVGGGLDGVRR